MMTNRCAAHRMKSWRSSSGTSGARCYAYRLRCGKPRHCDDNFEEVKMIVVIWFLVMYIFWIFYLVYAAFKQAKDSGRDIPRLALWLIAPFIAIGLIIDYIFDLICGSIM